MEQTVRISDLQAMKPGEQEQLLRSVVEQAMAPANGPLTGAHARIRAYEERYEMSTETLLEKLSREEIKETTEIANWLFWVTVVRIRGGR